MKHTMYALLTWFFPINRIVRGLRRTFSAPGSLGRVERGHGQSQDVCCVPGFPFGGEEGVFIVLFLLDARWRTGIMVGLTHATCEEACPTLLIGTPIHVLNGSYPSGPGGHYISSAHCCISLIVLTLCAFVGHRKTTPVWFDPRA